MSRCIQITGTLLTPRSDEYKAQLTREFVEKVIPYFEHNNVRAMVDKVYPLTNVKDAHLYMEGNHNIGKIILKNDE